jgi:lipopolysaccharide export system protein LptA
MPVRRSLQLLMLAPLAIFPGIPSAAEPGTTVWQPDRDKPVEILAEGTWVDDVDKIAIFWGNVVLTQGEVRLQCWQALLRYRAPLGDQPGVVERVECVR